MNKLFFLLLFCCPLIPVAATEQELIAKKATTCMACHGPQGISANPEWPNLAGQNTTYLRKQLLDLQKGTDRSNPLMSGVLAALTPEDIDDLAAYYAKMTPAAGTSGQNEQQLKRGEQLYRLGDSEFHITACSACHGPTGSGNDAAGFPALSGQHAQYTLLQLHAFKEGKRSNDLNQIMHYVCKSMDKKDMEAVALYIEHLNMNSKG